MQCRAKRLGRVAAACGLAFAVAAAGALAGSSGAQAESLWARAEKKGGAIGLFADARARGVGDLLTIIIVERAEAAASASTGSTRDGQLQVGPGQGLLQALPLIGGSGSTEFKGDGRSARTGSVKAQMTARVTEVLPNGALAIEGRQTIVINEEKQEIVLTGVVRPEDISSDNTVLSTYVADARISVQGDGALGAPQKPGILTRMFGWLF